MAQSWWACAFWLDRQKWSSVAQMVEYDVCNTSIVGLVPGPTHLRLLNGVYSKIKMYVLSGPKHRDVEHLSIDPGLYTISNWMWHKVHCVFFLICLKPWTLWHFKWYMLIYVFLCSIYIVGDVYMIAVLCLISPGLTDRHGGMGNSVGVTPIMLRGICLGL